ncbi:Protein CBG25845 [Caenorhabditis briggsae]|uniref:Protein CBG25845 n=1 Tax=Caenorhabditis briggsae TaxID=6238 RepID=B6IHB6_CAEBR|nr:Protein CBG25845 [Caenorhabditis briggsae]CAR99296.1 Protein CBG25845 [Caenorhabditis briggsae]
MQDGTKKKYIFLITRCIAGLLTSCAWLLIQCIYLRFIAPTSGNFPYYVLALALYIGSTYVLLGSYVGMAAILYLGVLNPIAFNQYLKLRTVYIAVCVIFLTAIVLSIPLATLQAAIAIPTASVKCTDKSLILVSGSLLITIISSSFVLISLKRHRKQFKKLDTVSNTSLNSALRLLSWTLFAEILISVAEIIPFVFMEYKKHQRSTSGCYWFNHASRVVSEASFALIESSIWSIALIIDPLTNVILDTTVSKKATSQIKWAQKSFVGLARNMTGKFSRRRITNGKETQVCQEEQIIQLDTISSIT